MTEWNRGPKRRPIDPWNRIAAEALARQGAPLAALDALGDAPSTPEFSDAARISAMAAAVFELHESRPQTYKSNLEPRLRSLKGQQPRLDLPLVHSAVDRLKAASAAQRKRLVRLRHYEYRGAAMARALLLEARGALPSSPDDSTAWASLAEQAAGLDFEHFCADIAEQVTFCLRARLYRANAERCRGNLDRAEQAFRLAQVEAKQLGVTDPGFWAEHASFQASLHRDRRDFPRALRAAHLAAAFDDLAGNSSSQARNLWKIASIHEQLGQPRAALAAIQRAKALVAASEEAELFFGLAHAEVSSLARCGEFLEAFVAYRTIEAQYALYPDSEGKRYWVAALIAAGRGKYDEAEVAYREAREVLIQLGNAYDAALVTLDWTLFLLDQNRPEEVLPLAVSMGQAFEALGVARETLASWAIFQTAAERRELTRAVAESMVRTLGEERAGAKPGR